MVRTGAGYGFFGILGPDMGWGRTWVVRAGSQSGFGAEAGYVRIWIGFFLRFGSLECSKSLRKIQFWIQNS